MTIERTRILLAGMAVLAASACVNNDGRFDLTSADPTWGAANRATMAAQVIDPSPEYDTPIPPTSAVNAVRAADAYREGRVEEPERIRTTDSGPQ